MRCQDRGTSFEYDPRSEAHHQFSFAQAPEPQKADSSVSGEDDGGVGPMAAVSFKLSMSSKGGARHEAERFSAVCVRCISGRRYTPSAVATDVGGGGSGALGGGMGGGLRSVRRGLKDAIVRNSQCQWDSRGSGIEKRVPAYRIVHVPLVLPLRGCSLIVLLEPNT